MTLKSLLLAGLATLTLNGCESNQDYLEEIASRSPTMILTGNRLEGELKVEALAIGNESDYVLLGIRKFKYVTFNGDNIHLLFKEFYDDYNDNEKNQAHSLVEIPLELAKAINVPVKAVFEGCTVRANLTDGSYRMRDCRYFHFEPKLEARWHI